MSIEFPAQPIALSLRDLVTSNQHRMIRALARDRCVNEDEECIAVMRCNPGELNRRTAAALIQHLTELPEVRRTYE